MGCFGSCYSGGTLAIFSLRYAFIFSTLARAYGTVEGSYYCNLQVVHSSHIINKKNKNHSLPLFLYLVTVTMCALIQGGGEVYG